MRIAAFVLQPRTIVVVAISLPKTGGKTKKDFGTLTQDCRKDQERLRNVNSRLPERPGKTSER
jgi:hypothetical protein